MKRKLKKEDKELNYKENFSEIFENNDSNKYISPIGKSKIGDIKKNEKKGKNYVKNEFIENNNSFIQSDIDEIKTIFNQTDLKTNEINDSSNLLEKSKDIQGKKDEITINELDPNIKDILILFVLSSNYYELLVKEKAKKAFNFPDNLLK